MDRTKRELACCSLLTTYRLHQLSCAFVEERPQTFHSDFRLLKFSIGLLLSTQRQIEQRRYSRLPETDAVGAVPLHPGFCTEYVRSTHVLPYSV